MFGVVPGETKITRLRRDETARIEEEAAGILGSLPASVWDGHSLPIPVEEIARESFGLRACHKSHEEMKEIIGADIGDGVLSGLLIGAVGEIWINRDEVAHPDWGQQRMRFTIGHELGHFVMHQRGQETIFCRRDEGEPGRVLEPTPRSPLELEANAFSAALMMPAGIVRAQLGTKQTGEEAVATVTTRFQVSDKAARRRVEDLRQVG